MAQKRTTTRQRAKDQQPVRLRIAPLTPDSPDPDARADANNPKLMRLLREAAARGKQPGGSITQEQLDRIDPLTDAEWAEAEALLAQWEAEDAAKGVVEPRAVEAGRRIRPAPAPRPKRGRPAADFNGRILVRVPRSVHRELAERAVSEGTTINQLILSFVSRGLGQDAGPAAPAT